MPFPEAPAPCRIYVIQHGFSSEPLLPHILVPDIHMIVNFSVLPAVSPTFTLSFKIKHLLIKLFSDILLKMIVLEIRFLIV